MKKINLILSIGFSVLSITWTVSAFYSNSGLVEHLSSFLLVGFLTYLQFQWSDIAFRSKDLKQALSAFGATILFCLAVSGNTLFWLSANNTEAARLAISERKVSLAQTDKITAIAIRNNCDSKMARGCITPADANIRAKEAILTAALSEYNSQIGAITNSDSFKIAASYVSGLDYKKFIFLRSLIGSLLLEIGIVFCWLSSRRSPLDLQLTGENTLKKTVDDLKSLDDLSPVALKVLAAHEKFMDEGRILPNGLPAQQSQFGAVVFGTQGTGNTKEAIGHLLALKLISLETFTKNLKAEV